VNQRDDKALHGGTRATLLVLLLLAFALRLTNLSLQNIWWDEARNIDVALRPFWQIPNAPELDIHPPLYFWLLHGWSLLAGLKRGMPWEVIALASRYLSVAAGLLGVLLLYQFTRRLGSRQAALLAAAIGACSPFWLAESQETRMYTLGFALLLAAALALEKVIRDWRLERDWISHRSPIFNL